MTTKRSTQHRKPAAPRFTIANAVVAKGQRLRADETANAMTFALVYTAKWHEAGGAR